MKDLYRTFLNYSFWLLGRKAYTKAEIVARLNRRAKKIKLDNATGIIEKVVKRLEELAFIDDGKILENYFAYHLPVRPEGKFKFIGNMRKRGIPKDSALQAWESRQIDEKSLAREFLEQRKKRFAGKNLSRLELKKKLAMALAGRGFSAETVWGVVSEE